MNIEREEILNESGNYSQYADENDGYYENDQPSGFADFAAFAKQEEETEEPEYYEEPQGQTHRQPHPEDFANMMEDTSENLSDYELKKRKGEALAELRRFQGDGIDVPNFLGMNSSLEDLETEVLCIKQKIKRKSTLEMSRCFLLAGVGFIEGASSYYDPHTPLTGWKDAFSGTINTYDDVLMKVYERYGFDTDKVDPLILLLLMVTMSGAMHVMTSKSSVPNFMAAMQNLKKDAGPVPVPVPSGPSGPSDEAMNLFNQINEEKKPRKKYTKKNK